MVDSVLLEADFFIRWSDSTFLLWLFWKKVEKWTCFWGFWLNFSNNYKTL